MFGDLLIGVMLGLSVAMPLGPGTLQLIRFGLAKGFFSALKVGLGCLSADLVIIVLSYLGLASIVSTPIVKILLLIIGAVVLMFIGGKGLIRKTELTFKDKSVDSPYLSGFLLVALTPFSPIFWMSAFGSVMSTVVTPLIALLGIMVGSFSWLVILSTLTAFSKKLLSKKFMKFVSLLGGVMIIGFGIRFLVLGMMELSKLI
ncbi:LysE family translocator [Candidatus Woesearchaeota archaeon]|nr:LysE family translocator [Candidatus Woesearchaeota archaeon]